MYVPEGHGGVSAGAVSQILRLPSVLCSAEMGGADNSLSTSVNYIS